MAARRTTRCCSAVALIAILTSSLATAGQLPPGPQPFPSPPSPVPLAKSDPNAPLRIFPLETRWTIALNSPLTASPAFDAARGFFPIEGNRIVAYDLTSGERLWIAEVGTAIEPTGGGDLVFVVTAEAILALRASDGSVSWRLPLAESLAIPLVWDTGWLVAATRSGEVLAIRGDDGRLLWRQTLGSAASARPALGADRLYVPTADGRVVALALEEGGKYLWEHKLGGAASDLLPLEDRLFVGSKDNFFYCLKTEDGSREWRWRTGADVIGVPVVDERNVYFVSLDNVLRALHRSNGVQQWKRTLPLRPTSGPVKGGDTLIVSGLSPTLRGFDVKDGAPAGEFALSAELAAPPHLLTVPGAPLPSIVVCTQDIAKGAVVTAFARSIEPPITPLAPLPNATAVPATLPSPAPPKS